jgi:hypothetical protein
MQPAGPVTLKDVIDAMEKARRSSSSADIDIVELCRMGGMPHLAPELIDARVSVDEARIRIQAARVEEDKKTQIFSHFTFDAGAIKHG